MHYSCMQAVINIIYIRVFSMCIFVKGIHNTQKFRHYTGSYLEQAVKKAARKQK